MRFIFCVPREQAQALRRISPELAIIETDVGRGGQLARLRWDQVTLRRILRRERVDILYSNGNFALFGAPCRQVLLVRMPLYFSDVYLTRILPKHRRRFRIEFALRRWLVCRSVRSADVVMTPSQSLLDDLRRFVDVPAERSVVNHYGTPTEAFRPKADAAGRNGHPFRMLHVSHYADHKNLGVVFEAIRGLRDKGFEDFEFVTTAQVQDPRYPESICRPRDQALLDDPRIAEKVRMLGDVDYGRIPALYASAHCFVFPSFTESYGHPLVEAMASGLPVVAADTPINREILGDAALYFEAFDADALARCLLTVAHDDAVADRLRRRSIARAGQFPWRGHVDRLLAVFARLGAERRGR
jgi:glycosyltransferase involved in cell wall biosynthesis